MVGGIGSAYGAMTAAALLGLISEWVAIATPYFGVMVALIAAGLVALLRRQDCSDRRWPTWEGAYELRPDARLVLLYQPHPDP
jgi:ABC-type branched-subunit amino acid transport system permease subunit